MYVSINKQLISFWNCFGLKWWKIFSYLKCLHGQNNTVSRAAFAGNLLPASYGLSGYVISLRIYIENISIWWEEFSFNSVVLKLHFAEHLGSAARFPRAIFRGSFIIKPVGLNILFRILNYFFIFLPISYIIGVGFTFHVSHQILFFLKCFYYTYSNKFCFKNFI
jgi:hypothetical protein